MSGALHELTVAELAAKLRNKQVSAVEAAQHFLARGKQHESLGAYLDVREDVTLAQAQAADARIAAGDTAPLLGVPIAHKDIFVTKDFVSTAGSKMLAGYRSPFDATVVDKLSQAGAVTLGKLNCDEFAMGSANENSAFARAQPVGHLTHSRWLLRRQCCGRGRAPGPGGTGTDTGGSIRQPASFAASPASSRPMAAHRATA
jgi:aspartyl-tRNA(Asn)/glutamyl-tRNA(Gln) amidotransferase subunit A